MRRRDHSYFQPDFAFSRSRNRLKSSPEDSFGENSSAHGYPHGQNRPQSLISERPALYQPNASFPSKEEAALAFLEKYYSKSDPLWPLMTYPNPDVSGPVRMVPLKRMTHFYHSLIRKALGADGVIPQANPPESDSEAEFRAECRRVAQTLCGSISGLDVLCSCFADRLVEDRRLLALLLKSGSGETSAPVSEDDKTP